MSIRNVVVGVFRYNPDIFNALSSKCRLKNNNITYKEIPHNLPKEQLISALNGCEVLFGNFQCIKPIALSLPSSIKWVQITFAGVDEVMNTIRNDQKSKPQKLQWTRMGEAYAQPIAEYVLGAVVALERDFKSMLTAQSKSMWIKGEEYNRLMHLPRPLSSLTAGIMGTGNIGMKIASYLKKLGMTIHGLKNHKMENVENSGLIDEYYYPDNLNGFLESCDYICNILPSTPATTGLLSGNRLEVCAFRKPAFINVGRGDVIDEDSLIHALNAGWISKAFLDVVPIEPLPHSSKLWEIENVVITPHTSGPYFTDTLASVFLENLKLYLDEKPLNFQIDFAVEY